MTEQHPPRLTVLGELDGLGDAAQLAETILGLLPETGVLVVDVDLRIVLMQGTVYERHGYDVDAAVGRHLYDVIPAIAWAHVGECWRAALAGEARALDLPSVNGKHEYWMHFAPLRRDAGIVGAFMVAQDVTDRRRPAGSRMPEFWRLSHDLLAVLSPDGRFLEVSGAWERTLGWSPEQLIGNTALELVVTGDRSGPPASTELLGDGAGEVVRRFRARDGSSRLLLWKVHQGPDGSLYVIAQDITERNEERELAARREGQLNDAQRLARVGSWETDYAAGLHTLSENLRELLGLDSRVCDDATFLACVHPDDRARMHESLAVRPEEDATADYRVQLPDGQVRNLSALFRPLRDAAGNITGLRGTVKDVTAARRSQAALGRSEERFRRGFDNAPIGMTLVDPASLRYVRVNDAFCGMVGRTREALVEMTFADLSRADELADNRANLKLLLSGELDQYVTEKRYLRPDGSEVWAAVSIAPVREPDGAVDVLFGQMIDITGRKAREAALHVQLDDIRWLGEIERAFEQDRFELHAQPIIDLATGETVQSELLIRMRDGDGELIPPGAFLPAAERHGVIRDIDRWVLARGVDLAARGIDVEINISAASIGDPGLVEDIGRELSRTGADPARLVFEITETALIEETTVAVTLAERLRHLGCRFALDDFGSGYGGFHYLKHLPMDFLKIDREFVRDARASEADQHVIRAIVGLAHGFGLQTIAEGVEDQETLDLLRELGVDHAQGFHIGRPARVEAP